LYCYFWIVVYNVFNFFIFIGGLVGRNYGGTLTNCYATGKVTGDYNTGGLVGYAYSSSIANCYATGEVRGGDYTGGLVGWNESGTIKNCYATGSVSGNNDRTGGLVGCNYKGCTITNCYATGEVTGNKYTGGLVGSNYGTITNCYATGKVTGGSDTGGLVGYNNSGTITNSYYNSDPAGQINNGIGTPLTTAKMKQQSNFKTWDFDTIWNINEGFSYPFLINNEQSPHPGMN
jgi:hypothetical protein